MEPVEFENLMKAKAEADEELRIYQKLKAEYSAKEPIEAMLAPDRQDEIMDGLKNIAQDMADYHSEYDEDRRTDKIEAEQDKKHSFRHDFLVAAFTVALTLFFEHIHDIFQFVLEFFRSLS